MSRKSGRSAKSRTDAHDTSDADLKLQLTSNKRSSAARSPRPKRTKSLNLSPDFLFTSPKSCLVSMDLSSLINAGTWEMLSSEEQEECLDLLSPVDSTTQADGSRLLNNVIFRDVVLQDTFRDFQDRLAQGFMLPSHVQKLEQAHKDRLDGKADRFKEEHFEKCWGDKQVLDYTVTAGVTTNLKLTTMIACGIFSVDDVFAYHRSFGSRKHDPGKLIIQEECIVTNVITAETECCMVFKFASGTMKHSQHNEGDIITDPISSLSQLEHAILETDGRIHDPPNGNSWKVFRLKRKAADLGALWEVRERAYQAAVNVHE